MNVLFINYFIHNISIFFSLDTTDEGLKLQKRQSSSGGGGGTNVQDITIVS